MDRLGVGKLCLALPGAVLDHPWGDDHDANNVGGNMFALVVALVGLSFKASEIAYEALTQTGRARPAPYLARARWVHLDDPADWPDDDLGEYLRMAYLIVAAKLPKAERRRLGLDPAAPHQ